MTALGLADRWWIQKHKSCLFCWMIEDSADPAGCLVLWVKVHGIDVALSMNTSMFPCCLFWYFSCGWPRSQLEQPQDLRFRCSEFLTRRLGPVGIWCSFSQVGHVCSWRSSVLGLANQPSLSVKILLTDLEERIRESFSYAMLWLTSDSFRNCPSGQEDCFFCELQSVPWNPSASTVRNTEVVIPYTYHVCTCTHTLLWLP